MIKFFFVKRAINLSHGRSRHVLTPIAITLLAVKFKRIELVDTIGPMINESELDPVGLELPMTASMIMENMEAIVMVLHGLHYIGVSLAIYGFTTKHPSLAYLKQFSMDKLKVDRSLVNIVLDDPDDVAIAPIIINRAKKLNRGVIAKRVETIP